MKIKIEYYIISNKKKFITEKKKKLKFNTDNKIQNFICFY